MPKDRRIKDEGRRILLNKNKSGRHIFVEYRELHTPIKTHWHSYFELEIVTGGHAVHTLNGEVFEEKGGSVYLLNPTDFHSVEPIEPLNLYNLSFDESMISDKRLCTLLTKGITKRFALNEEGFARVLSLVKLCEAESLEEGGGCSYELCESLLTILMRYASPRESGELFHYQASGIRRALIYIDLHFRENPSLETVAAQAGFHKNYFSELFRRITGESYTERLNTLRINYAKTLLRSGFSVTEACYNSGFGSLSNFLVTFKKYVGISPMEFKRRE